MQDIIHLSDIWEHTITKILNHDPKSEMGIIMRAWVKHSKLEDFNSLLNFNVDHFTPSGTLCYYTDNGDSVVKMLPNTLLKELYNLRWYIQYLIDESGYDYDDDEFLGNPLHEDNWMLQTNRKFMKYVIYILHSMTHKHVNKNPIRPIIKVIPYHKHHTDEGESAKNEGESATSTELSEDSTSDTTTEATEDSKPIETHEVPNDIYKSTHNETDSPTLMSTSEFESPEENGEQIIVQDNKLLSINLTGEIQNRKSKGS